MLLLHEAGNRICDDVFLKLSNHQAEKAGAWWCIVGRVMKVGKNSMCNTGGPLDHPAINRDFATPLLFYPLI